MIPRKNNIPKKYFPTVLKGGSLYGAYFRVVISDTIFDNKPHIAIIIAKKYAKLATERNFLKRAISSEIECFLEKLPQKTIVFMVQKPMLYEKTTISRKNTTKELRKDVQNIIKQIIKKYEKTL